MNSKILATLLLAIAVITTAHAESYTFSNSTNIDVPEYNIKKTWHGTVKEGGTKNDVVGSSINVSNTVGKISDLNVTINGLTSKAFIDMVFVLIGPNNTGVVLSSNAGGANENSQVPTVDLTFDDEASSHIARSTSFYQAEGENKNLSTASYQTSAYSMDWFYQRTGQFSVLDPVGEGYFGDPGLFAQDNLLSAFDNISANGVWQLLAFDNYATDATSYSGWSLNFSSSGGSTTGAVPEPAEWALIALAFIGIIGIKAYSNKSSIA